MERMTPDEMIQVIEDKKNGYQIQWTSDTLRGKWEDCPGKFYFNFGVCRYRRKLEKKSGFMNIYIDSCGEVKGSYIHHTIDEAEAAGGGAYDLVACTRVEWEE